MEFWTSGVTGSLNNSKRRGQVNGFISFNVVAVQSCLSLDSRKESLDCTLATMCEFAGESISPPWLDAQCKLADDGFRGDALFE
jgi:hypothetical protein